MARSTHDRKREVIAAVEALQESSPSRIQAALPAHWQGEAKGVELRQLLRRLAKNHVIDNPRYGRYTPAPNPDLHPIDGRALYVREIDRCLRDDGGIMRTRDIHKALYDRPYGATDHGHEYRSVTLALKETPQFRQDFGRGYWNLPADDREGLPLPGRWAAFDIKAGWFGRGERSGFKDWQHKRDEFFYDVGSAFRGASEGWTIGDVARVRAVRAALLIMAKDAPGPKNDARAAYRDRLEREARDSGATDAYDLAEAVGVGGDGWLEHLYAMFLRGDVRAHLAAPAEFYRSCADVFGVCAAALSRGRVLPLA